MNDMIEKRKQNWVEFYDMTSSVNRLIVVDYTRDFPQRPPLWWAERAGRMGLSEIYDAVGKYGEAP